MELWIRSQDRKTLLKMNRIYVFSQTIFAEYIDNREIDLGTYKTNERALEVLDEIQNILKPKYILNSSSIKPDGDSWVENGIVM